MKKITITIRGTHCPACKTLIGDVCSDFKEIKLCNVNFKTGKTIIEHDENLDLIKLKKEIESLGKYKVEL